MPNTYVCLQTEHVKKFQCDGKSCQSLCCKGWGIAIDKAALKKYKKIKGKAGKEILSHIKKKDEKHMIKLREDRSCPFLREDLLCSLQHDYGEEYLSDICRTYPRLIRAVNQLLECSLSLTCPVAANLVLLQETPMEFEQVEFVTKEAMDVRVFQWSRGLVKLPELQYASISLLQDRRFSIDQRLVILGFFLEHIQDTEDMEKWSDIVRFYASDDIAEQAPEMFRAIRFQPEHYLKSMFGLMEFLYGEKSKLHIWLDGLEDVTAVFGFTEDHLEIPVRQLLSSYEEHYPAAKNELMDHYGYIFENYLVNEFFANMYPFRVEGNLVQNYGLFLLGYKLMEFILVAMRANRGASVDGETLVENISVFANFIDHTPKYLEAVREEAWKQGAGTTAFLKGLLQAE
ncbi:MAG: flagellin lysine-N-methylase [Selenomonadaceae bacterium]|nr:flagellin lysine-N-methylase [Selenomonadaceae bacterium]